MIHYTKESIFDSHAYALVNPVNCVGVSGKGLALEFKKRFPENYDGYRGVCQKKQMHPGMLLTLFENDKYVINFPTKVHWKNASKIEYISRGMPILIHVVKELKIPSVAIPRLGCGLGGLHWPDVEKIIIEHLNELPDVDFYLHML